MKFPFVLIALSLTLGFQCGHAAQSVKSPDGQWYVATVPEHGTSAIGIFKKGSDQAETIIAPDASYDTRVDVKWSADSTKVFVLQHFPRGTGVDAAWFDGAKWHRTFELDSDYETMLEMVKQQGVKGTYKTETAALGEWRAPDTIEVSGQLGFMGEQALFWIPYSFHLQIIPGSYAVNPLGYDLGGLKGSNYQTSASQEASPAAGEQYVFGEDCALSGFLDGNTHHGEWILKLKEPIAIGSNDPKVQGLGGIREVILIGLPPEGAAYFTQIAGKSVKVEGTLKKDERGVEFVLSQDTVKALEAR